MKILLDTHIFLWAFLHPEKLTQAVIENLLENEAHEKFLSAASCWEIAIKWAKGKLELPEPPKIYVPSRMLEANIKPLPITHWETLKIDELPPIHQDPFDHLLITQANHYDLTILTDDSVIEQYAVKLINAEKYRG